MFAADHIRQLTQGHTTTEHIRRPKQGTDGRYRTETYLHTVTHPALLDQLDQTVTGATGGGETIRTAYGSKPAGRIDVLAFLERIDKQSKTIATQHGIPNLPLRRRLQAIGGILGDATDRTVRSWWSTARILTTHDTPPFAPDVPCPIETCERRGTLRVRIEEQAGVCVECHTVWDETDFGRLRLWVEWSAEHLRGPQHWVNSEDTHGYDEQLGYVVECQSCVPWRAGMAERETARLSQAPTRTRGKQLAHAS